MRAIVRAADADRLAADGLVAVRAGGIAALATTRDRAPAPDEAELREHDAIARTLHERATTLPARFGSVFADARSLARALEARAADLTAALERVGDRVELTATLAWRVAPARRSPEAASGRAYLEALAEEERDRAAADQLVARLVTELPAERPLTRHRTCPRAGVAAIVAILVSRDEVMQMRLAVESFARRSAEVSAQVYGPFPPYSFVS